MICTMYKFSLFGQSVHGENFNDFIERFSTDSIFQISRVSFPLEFIFVNDESFMIDTTYIFKEDYVVLKNEFYNSLRKYVEAYPIVYDNFECNLSKSDERVFRWKGFTGMDVRYYFRRIDGKWRLLRMSSIGT